MKGLAAPSHCAGGRTAAGGGLGCATAGSRGVRSLSAQG